MILNIKNLGYMLLSVIFLTEPTKAQHPQKIRINPDQAYGGNVSDYFKDIEYIPLETTPESTFGYITRLIATDSSFVIYDSDTRRVYFFDLTGKFIRKIQGAAASTSENIEYDSVGGCVVFSSRVRGERSLKKTNYTKFGEPINNKKYNVAEWGSVSFGNGYRAQIYGSYISNLDKVADTSTYRLKVFKGDTLYKEFLPIKQSENLAICTINGFMIAPDKVENNSFYISTPLDYLVYHVTKDTAKAIFQFVFPANRVFNNELLQSQDRNLIKNINENFLLRPDPLKIMNVSNIFFGGNNLFFKLNPRNYLAGAGSDIQYQYNFIFNTQTSKLIALERLNGDIQNDYLPIFNERLRVDGLTDFLDGYYYSNISSFNMFRAYRENAQKKPNYPPVLQRYFAKQTRRSNPVLVRMKLKE